MILVFFFCQITFLFALIVAAAVAMPQLGTSAITGGFGGNRPLPAVLPDVGFPGFEIGTAEGTGNTIFIPKECSFTGCR